MNNINLFKQIFKELIEGEVNTREFIKIFNREIFVDEYLKDLNKEEFRIINEVKNALNKKLNTKQTKEIITGALKKIENLNK